VVTIVKVLDPGKREIDNDFVEVNIMKWRGLVLNK
jgi:hypothetical protein